MKDSGFSYLELLAVVVITAILVKIALINNVDIGRETRRIAMQAQLLELRSKINEERLTKTSQVSIGDILVKSSNPYYTLSYYNTPLAYQVKSNWGMYFTDAVLVATPIAGGLQSGDGVICITLTGYRYWEQAAPTCKFPTFSLQSDRYMTMAEVRGSTWYGE